MVARTLLTTDVHVQKSFTPWWFSIFFKNSLKLIIQTEWNKPGVSWRFAIAKDTAPMLETRARIVFFSLCYSILSINCPVSAFKAEVVGGGLFRCGGELRLSRLFRKESEAIEKCKRYVDSWMKMNESLESWISNNDEYAEDDMQVILNQFNNNGYSDGREELIREIPLYR